MFHFIQGAPENVLAVAVTGKLNKGDYEDLKERLEEEAKKRSQIRLFIEFVRWKGMTLDAAIEDIKTLFEHYGDIRKMAVAGNEEWQKAATRLSDALTPNIDIQFFGSDERAEAFEWLE